MKSLRMSKMLGSMKMGRRGGSSASTTSADPNEDGPEATAGRNVISFCESTSSSSGDEVLYLPPIVDAAEDSPAAAAECARLIRKYLKRDYATKPTYQNNAIMLVRILADNPGPTFTRNIDQKFTDTVKELLRNVRDPSVRQLLMETLDYFENTKAYDEGLALIIAMWKKEKEKAQGKYSGQASQPPAPRTLNAPPFNPHAQNYFSRSHNSKKLPDPVELASRLEEARTSANLLQQVVTNTPPGEVLDNDLIKEFADRCLSASRSIQMYMRAEDPTPDNETMESLIDTNEHLQNSLNLHQRSMLNARKHVAAVGGQDDNDRVSPIDDRASNGYSARRPSPSSFSDQPPLPPRKSNGDGNGKGKGRDYEPAMAGPSRTHTPDDPFRDPAPEPSGSGSYDAGIGRSASGAGRGSSWRYQDEEPRLAYEPFHPGFSTTPSYLDRQESALGKETMHGGAADASHSRGTVRDNESDIYDTDDVTTPPAKQKESVYRY